MTGKVCVFGAFNVDVVARLSRFPRPGESMIAASSLMGAGGKGANQALAAARAGARVHYIGKVGTDSFAEFAKHHLDASEINVCTLFHSQDKPTGNALIYVSEENGENMIGVDPGANLAVTEQEIESCLPVIKSSDLLLIQMENNADAIVRLLQHAHDSNVYVILNPAPFQKIPDEALALADLLTPNSTEAELLTGVEVNDLDSAAQAARVLHNKGINNVLITLGLKGALLSTPSGRTHIPAYPAHPVDTTGAGDAFNGSLAACLAQGDKLEDAALFASAYASVSVERIGAAQAMPYKQEAMERMRQHASLAAAS